MTTHVPILKGKDAEQFEAYVNRVVTKKEVEFMQNCDRIYLSHCTNKKPES